jgi:hypothetical protein
MSRVYVYRVIVALPEQPDIEGYRKWREEASMRGFLPELDEETEPGEPGFRWPTRRNYFSLSAAERAAYRLRRWGARATVASRLVEFPDEAAVWPAGA